MLHSKTNQLFQGLPTYLRGFLLPSIVWSRCSCKMKRSSSLVRSSLFWLLPVKPFYLWPTVTTSEVLNCLSKWNSFCISFYWKKLSSLKYSIMSSSVFLFLRSSIGRSHKISHYNFSVTVFEIFIKIKISKKLFVS